MLQRKEARIVLIYKFAGLTSLFTDGCENKKCEHYGSCENDASGEAKCFCPDNCDETVSTLHCCDISSLLKLAKSLFCILHCVSPKTDLLRFVGYIGG